MGLLDERDLSRLREHIAAYSGLDVSVLSDDALRQAVGRRLAARALDRPEQYWPLVQLGGGEGAYQQGDGGPGTPGQESATGELQQLVQILTNKETFFFREGHHFEALHREVLPALLASDRPRPKTAFGWRNAVLGRPDALSGRRLRVWSAGCATGEEPYSVAIALLEYRARHGFFEAEIVATDIDEAALHIAQQGCYGQRSLRLVPEEARRRYFRSQARGSEEHRFCILPDAAALVTFRRYNLADENPPPDLADFDLIFCRNVSIYFHPAARDRLNARLAAALRPGGYLFVASAETMGHNQGRLELISLGNTFLFRKQVEGSPGASRTTGTAPPGRVSPAQAPAAGDAAAHRRRDLPPAEHRRGGITARRSWLPGGPGTSRGTDELQREIDPLAEALRSFQQHEFDAALVHLDRLSDVERERLDVRCLRAAILLQREELQEAEVLCQEVLARDPWHADAHFMLGLTYRQRGQPKAAALSLKQAIYLQPEHRDAHFFLAEVYRTLGLETQARNEYENTLNILAASGEPVFYLTGLPDETLRHACQANLRNLRPSPLRQPQQAAGRRR